MAVMLDWIFIAVYFIIVLIIGIVSARKQSKEDFLIAERKLGAWNISASVAAGFMGGGLLVAYVSYIYEFGMAAFWVFIGIVLGFMMLLLYYKKLKEMSDREEFYTISDYFKFKYGKSVGVISAVTIILYSLFFILIELIGGGRILSGLLGIPYYLAVLLGAGVVLFYLGLGGFKSVVKTDFFQYLVMVLFALVIAFFLIRGSPVPASEFTLSGGGWGNAIAFILLGAFTTFMAPDLWQRIYAAKSKKIVRNALYLTSVILLIFGFLVTLIGIVAKINYPDILPGEALLYGLSHLLPAGLLGLGLVMLFAAIMSSLDSYLFILGMNISEDITKNYKDMTKEQLIRLTRWSIMGFTIVSVIIALLIQSIITVALAFGSISLALIPSLIGGFHFKLKRKAVFLSILTGIISVFIILFSGYITPESSIISLPVSLVFLLVGQWLFRE